MWWLRVSWGILFQGSYFFPHLILTQEWLLPIALSYSNKRLTVFSIGYFQVSPSFFKSYSATISKTALLFNLVPLMGSWRVGSENNVTIKKGFLLCLTSFRQGYIFLAQNKFIHHTSCYTTNQYLKKNESAFMSCNYTLISQV